MARLRKFIELLPIIVVLAFVPLFMRLVMVNFPVENYPFLPYEVERRADIYSFGKSMLIIACSLLSVFIIIFKSIKHKNMTKNPKLFYFLYAYIVILLLSYIFSIDIYVASIGYIERYEGVFVLLSYIILFMYVSLFLKEEDSFRTVIIFWILSISILFVIGFSEYTGNNIFANDFVERLILTKKHKDLQLNLNPSTLISQTLYNPNYVSMYAGMAFPFFLTLLLLDESKIRKLLYLLACGMLFFNIVGSTSRNGIIGLLLGIIVLCIFIRYYIKRHLKVILILCTGFIILLFITAQFAHMNILKRFTNELKQVREPFNPSLNSIRLEEDYVLIDHDDYVLSIRYNTVNLTASNEFGFMFFDENNNQLSYYEDGDVLRLESPQYENLGIQFIQYFNGDSGTILYINGIPWTFDYKDGSFYYRNNYRRIAPIEEAPYLGFESNMKFASSRGYIWSRTLPLIADYWLLGSGPDTYGLAFPHYDYVAKTNSFDNPSTVIDKPHNIYLDYAINTGIFSLIAIMGFIIGYLIWCCKLYLKCDLKNFYAKVGIASMTAVLGYLGAGFFVSSNVQVTPVFWIVFGIGFAANLQYVRSLTNEDVKEANTLNATESAESTAVENGTEAKTDTEVDNVTEVLDSSENTKVTEGTEVTNNTPPEGTTQNVEA